MIDPKLIDYCQSDTQRETIQAVIDNGSNAKAAKALGKGRRSVDTCVNRVKAYAAKHGHSPEHGLNEPAAPGLAMRGTSDLYDRDGNRILHWVKTSRDDEQMLEIMRGMVESMAESVPPVEPIPAPHENHDELMSVYPMGDPHFGMYSWAAETGNDFDLDVAERDLYAAVDYLVDRSPPSKRAVLLNLGDLFHAENMEGVTSRSGNVLDIDTRFPMMIDVGVRTLRRCIHRMLEKHENVEIINTPGNHDETMAFFMSILLGNVYENEPRLHIHREPTQRFYVEHGRCLIGSVHGHRTKDATLPGIMATEMPEAWGRTRHRVWYRGHHHQDRLEEFNGCVVKQCRTLAPGDAYAVGNGYLSGQDMKCDVYHARYGLQTSFTCGIDVLRDG